MSRCRVLVAFTAVATAGVGACHSQHPSIVARETQTMSNPPQASRPPAPEIAPIEHKGVRYEQDRVDASKGDRTGGYLAAIDPKTGKKLWRLQVYEVADHSAAGVSNIGLYFKSMRLVPGRDELEIENESGGRYIVDLVKRVSTRVAGPQPATAPAAPPKPKPRPE